MDDVQLAHFRQRLLDIRSSLQATGQAAEEAAKPVELDQASVGRLSRMDAMQGQAMALENQRRRSQTLRNVEIALARIDSGDYGYCSSCDDEIYPKRLEVDPTTPLCIVCAEKKEQS